jgi:hypothetical protein
MLPAWSLHSLDLAQRPAEEAPLNPLSTELLDSATSLELLYQNLILAQLCDNSHLYAESHHLFCSAGKRGSLFLMSFAVENKPTQSIR